MNENIELMMPIKAASYDHQKKAFAFACDKFGVFDERLKSRGTALLMEMGTGKTIVSIAVAGCMYQYGKVNRVLVVAPLSILGVWEEEFEKFADFPYSMTILKGTAAKKKEQLTKLPDGGLQVVVVNYESAWRLEKELLAYNADLVIADEAHKLKENRTSQSKGMHHIGDKARYKLLLTGTVITNRELDVFSQYRFLNPQIFGTSFYAFRNQYFDMGGYDETKAQYDAVSASIAAKEAKNVRLSEFISLMRSQKGIVSEFDISLWSSTVEFVTVGRDKDITVTFRDGTEIKA